MASICWIDDEEDQIHDMVEHLRMDLNHDVVVLRDCNELLLQLPNLTFDLFIMDLWLPVGDEPLIPEAYRRNITARGLWLVGELKNAVRATRIPIIVLSGGLDVDIREALTLKLDSQFDKILAKPIDFDSMLLTIKEALRFRFNRKPNRCA